MLSHVKTLIGIILGIALVMTMLTFIVYLQSTASKHFDILALPMHDTASEPVPDFASITDIQQKKQAYFDYLRPVAEQQNAYFLALREHIESLRDRLLAGKTLKARDKQDIAWLIKEYRVDESLETTLQLEALLKKVDIIPLDLVLVQSANESGWGTSRFATEGYNFFGIWCFVKNCGFVPKRRNSGAGHEVAKFDDVSHAMYAYMRNLNRHAAYKELREIRSKLRKSKSTVNGYALAEGLSSYSERGSEYIEELRTMIRVNKELMSTQI